MSSEGYRNPNTFSSAGSNPDSTANTPFNCNPLNVHHMHLGKPIVQLQKKEVSGQMEYAIFCVTWFNDTRYEPDGHATLPTTTNVDGHFQIDLNVDTSNTNNLELLTPVVHAIDLGAFPLSASDPTLEVRVYEGAQLIGKTILHDDAGVDFS